MVQLIACCYVLCCTSIYLAGCYDAGLRRFVRQVVRVGWHLLNVIEMAPSSVHFVEQEQTGLMDYMRSLVPLLNI